MNNKKFILMIGCVVFVVVAALVLFNKNTEDKNGGNSVKKTNVGRTQTTITDKEAEISTKDSDNQENNNNQGNVDNRADEYFFNNVEADNAQEDAENSRLKEKGNAEATTDKNAD